MLLLYAALQVVTSQQQTPAPAPVPATEAAAAEPTPEAEPQAEPQAVADIVVVAERPAVLNQIDRRVYDVGKDPAAQTSSALEILDKIPSVSADLFGRLRLLGQSSVTLLIDGQKPANDAAILRTLTGANIDRIEVMTNPGVQYGPVGTGGIINIITRRRTTPGVTGVLSTSLDAVGRASLNASPTLTVGRWTLAGTLGLSAQDTDEGSSTVHEVFSAPGVLEARTQETRTGETRGPSVSTTARADYRIDDNRRVSLGVEASRSTQDIEHQARFVSADAPANDHLERNAGSTDFRTGALTGSYSRTGPKDGEELTLAGRADVFVVDSDTVLDSDYGPGSPSNSRFRTDDQSRYDTESLKLDYKRPLSGGRIVTAGAGWQREGQRVADALEVLAGDFVPAGPASHRLDSARNVTSAYATYQFDTAGFTVLPGLSVEYQDLAVSSAAARGGNSGADLYPSLHVSRKLGEGLQLNLSYSRRINRPQGESLDPTLNYYRVGEAYRGNPDLRPQTTDSFEARLEFTRPRYSVTATAYDKESRDLWSSFQERLDDGLILTTTVNAGRAADRGIELSARGKLGGHLSYVTTTNLFAQTRRVLDGDGETGDRTSVTWSGNGQLEYAATPRNGLEADKIQLAVTYNGPFRDLQTEGDPTVTANLTWRHPVTKKVTAVLVVRNLFNSSTGLVRTAAADFTDTSRYDNQGVLFRIGLSYRLGAVH